MPLNHDAVGRLLVASTDIVLAASKFSRAVEDHRQHATTPKLLSEVDAALRNLHHVIWACAPDVATAMACGLESTDDLHQTEKSA